MNKHIVIDELSAYIDGVSENPEEIRRHLQSCPRCAQHHLHLLKLSRHLGAMNPPAARADFTDRVMARVLTESTLNNPSPWLRRKSLTAVTALAALLAVVGVGAYLQFGGTHTEPILNSAAPHDVSGLLARDEARIALGQLLDEGTWIDPEFMEVSNDDASDDLTVDALLQALVEPEEIDESEAWYSESDLTALLDELADVDAEILTELLNTHGSEG